MLRKQRKPGKRTTAKKVQESQDKPFTMPPAVEAKAEEDEAPWDEEGLTEKQKRFVYFYIGEAAGNGAKAAQLAGYKDDNRLALAVQARHLLIKTNIQRALGRLRGLRFGSNEDVRAGIAEIATGNAADFLQPDKDGNLHLSLERMAEAGSLGLLQQVQEEQIKVNDNLSTVKLKFKLYDRLKALETLAKMNGQLKDHVEVGGTVKVKGYVGVTPDDWDAPGTSDGTDPAV